jgi:hypothetical protein
MKRIMTMAALLTCLASPALAQNVWQGDLFATHINNQAKCAAVNIQQGDFVRAVFRPGFAAGGKDALALYYPNAAILIDPTAPLNGKMDGANRAIIRTMSNVATMTTMQDAGLSGVNISPSSPKADDKAVEVTITVQHIFTRTTLSGCVATYDGTLSKRPPG